MSIWTNKNIWYFICASVAVIAVGTSTFLYSTTPETIPIASAPVHGGWVDALDAEGGGEPIDSVLKRLDRDVGLPDPAIVGEVVKAVDARMEPSDPSGLLVLYTSGIKVKIAPGQFDFAAALEHTKYAKVGNSKKPFRVETVAGRPTWVTEGGIKQLQPGNMKVPKGLTWNIPGYTYVLEVSSDSSVSLEVLKKAAESIK